MSRRSRSGKWVSAALIGTACATGCNAGGDIHKSSGSSNRQVQSTPTKPKQGQRIKPNSKQILNQKQTKQQFAKQRQSFAASGQYKKGYDDGSRDGERALFDSNPGWMWLWLTDDQYHKGYEQGWKDGRVRKKIVEQQAKMARDAKKHATISKEKAGEQTAKPAKPPPKSK